MPFNDLKKVWEFYNFGNYKNGQHPGWHNKKKNVILRLHKRYFFLFFQVKRFTGSLVLKKRIKDIKRETQFPTRDNKNTLRRSTIGDHEALYKVFLKLESYQRIIKCELTTLVSISWRWLHLSRFPMKALFSR